MAPLHRSSPVVVGPSTRKLRDALQSGLSTKQSHRGPADGASLQRDWRAAHRRSTLPRHLLHDR